MNFDEMVRAALTPIPDEAADEARIERIMRSYDAQRSRAADAAAGLTRAAESIAVDRGESTSEWGRSPARFNLAAAAALLFLTTIAGWTCAAIAWKSASDSKAILASTQDQLELMQVAVDREVKELDAELTETHKFASEVSDQLQVSLSKVTEYENQIAQVNSNAADLARQLANATDVQTLTRTQLSEAKKKIKEINVQIEQSPVKAAAAAAAASKKASTSLATNNNLEQSLKKAMNRSQSLKQKARDLKIPKVKIPGR